MASMNPILQSYGVGSMGEFNAFFGYEEAMLRGFRLGFLSDQDYHHIQQCDTMDDVKLNLQETDYGSYIQKEKTVSPSVIRTNCLRKLVDEFEYLRCNAVEPLATFMDFILKDYMIDNVMLILKATLNNPNINITTLIEQIHPLGKFEDSTLKSIASFENSVKGYAELYQSVLIDTPIGKYFEQVIHELSQKQDGTSVQDMLKEMPTMKLENLLRKFYMEDFFFFCKDLGGETAEVMCGLLQARADAMAINITLNSFGTALNNPSQRVNERNPLYPSIGRLYPEITEKLAVAGDERELGACLNKLPDFREIFDKHLQGKKTIDDAFYEREAMLCEVAFEEQFNFASFYCYVRLKEQEIRNLVWVCECIAQRQKDRINDHFVPIFSRDAEFRSKE